jgi:hypothetical protein
MKIELSQENYMKTLIKFVFIGLCGVASSSFASQHHEQNIRHQSNKEPKNRVLNIMVQVTMVTILQVYYWLTMKKFMLYQIPIHHNLIKDELSITVQVMMVIIRQDYCFRNNLYSR